MVALSVPRPLQERLGEAATESLVEILRQIESNQESGAKCRRSICSRSWKSGFYVT